MWKIHIQWTTEWMSLFCKHVSKLAGSLSCNKKLKKRWQLFSAWRENGTKLWKKCLWSVLQQQCKAWLESAIILGAVQQTQFSNKNSFPYQNFSAKRVICAMSSMQSTINEEAILSSFGNLLTWNYTCNNVLSLGNSNNANTPGHYLKFRYNQ